MSGVRHRQMAGGRWQEFSLVEQLGHVGSEVSRALNWRDRDARLAWSATERALELLDLTLADPRHRLRPARLRELARAREIVADYLAGDNAYGSTPESLRKYFDAYAIAAARARAGQ